MTRHSRLRLVALVLVVAHAASARPAGAQRIDIWLDAAATHARPPAGVVGSAATYGLLGARLRVAGPGGATFGLAVHGGRAVNAGRGAWLEANTGIGVGRTFGPLSLGGRVEGFGLRYRDPFSYTAYGVRFRPRVGVQFGGFVLEAEGRLTRGSWHTADRSGTLAVTGGAVALGRRVGELWLELTGERYRAHNGTLDGTYQSVGVRAALERGAFTARARASVWQTPFGREFGFGGGANIRLGDRTSLRLTLAKTVRDPLYGSPGTLAASIGVRVRVASAESEAAGPVPAVQVLGPAGDGRRVRFQLRAPEAARVAVAGDFSGWTPVPLRRGEHAWWVEITLGPGLHHFAFLINGERWTVPEHAPGVTTDGWGRRNASIVIEGG